MIFNEIHENLCMTDGGYCLFSTVSLYKDGNIFIFQGIRFLLISYIKANVGFKKSKQLILKYWNQQNQRKMHTVEGYGSYNKYMYTSIYRLSLWTHAYT